jgi:hypothetical protein
MERKLPPASVLQKLRAVDGLTLTEISKKYGTTPAAVWHSLDRAGMTESSAMYNEIVPWQIQAQHRSLVILEHFRRLAKRAKGLPLDEHAEKSLNNWLRDMAHANVVVAYHPDAPPNAASKVGGFYYVTREDFDGDRWYRDPVREAVRLAEVREAQRDRKPLGAHAEVSN